jgi:lysophospholipase L1-like esterase
MDCVKGWEFGNIRAISFIARVELLVAGGPLTFSRDTAGLVVNLPEKKLNEYALKIMLKLGKRRTMKTPGKLYVLMILFIGASSQAADKALIDYFLPMPIESSLVSNVWGAPGVFPRDPKNGLEDETMKQWCYWDGQIIKGPDGKYHMFASRWDQAKGHNGWWSSLAVHAVSNKATGPYIDKGLCWPDNQGGKGHNVTALVLPDGRYAVVVSETRPGDVFVSKSLDGPWEHLGSIKVATNEFSKEGKMSNVSIMVRPDGNFMIVPRSGAILISKDGILGPYVVQGPSVYPNVKDLPLSNLEDPVIWYSGGLYHIVVNSWSARKAYHITSPDGINNWTFRGLAYDPTTDFLRYTDGTVNHWNKIERPGVLMENGHVTHFTFAVLDVPKEQEKGNDSHGSKIIVVPFDGAAMDRDMQNLSTQSKPDEPSAKPIPKDPMPVFFPKARILFQGDSITDGNRGRNNDLNHILGHGYQFVIACKYGAELPERKLTFMNRGVSGNKVSDLLIRWQKDINELNPDILSILIGVNDLSSGVPAEQFEQQYDQLLSDTVNAMPNIKLVLGEPFGLPVGGKKANWEKYRADLAVRQAIVARLGEKYHAPVVHYQKMFEDAVKRAPADYWIWDGVHPTFSGHQLMADEWIRTVRDYWPESSSTKEL